MRSASSFAFIAIALISLQVLKADSNTYAATRRRLSEDGAKIYLRRIVAIGTNWSVWRHRDTDAATLGFDGRLDASRPDRLDEGPVVALGLIGVLDGKLAYRIVEGFA